MSQSIKKALLCGLGLASLTKEAIQKTAEDLVSRSKISEEEGRRLVKDLHRRSAHAQRELEKHVDGAVHMFFEHLNLPAMITDRLKGHKAAGRPAAKSSRRRRATTAAKR
jgi:polyhydroxyalkanoate synthesis regulator phasin